MTAEPTTIAEHDPELTDLAQELQARKPEFGLKPYASYKDSRLPWISKIPAHWEVHPNRALFQEIIARNHPDEPMLSVTINAGVRHQADLLSESSKKDSSNLDKKNYKLVQPGDIAYNKMRAWQGAIGVSNYRGIISPAYIVMRSRGRHNPRYLHYLFRTPAFAKEAERWSYGITSDQWSLRAEDFKKIYSPLPPREEQDAIVRFLDYADHRIQRYIAAKQKLIKLLEEQKQAIIHQAVTRGLNPNAPLKPSGIEWLMEIPQQWEVVRNGQLFQQRAEVGFPELPILEVSLNTGVRVRDFDNGARKQVMSNRSGYKRAAEGDIAYNMMRMWQGAIGVAPVDGLVSPAYVVAKPLSRTNAAFYTLLFRTTFYKQEIDKYSRGIVKDRNRLYWEDFKQMPSIRPPADEQRQIAESVTERTESLQETKSRIQGQIETLCEYRTRLIADIVIGKMDVREAADALPSEANDANPLEDPPHDFETEEVDDSEPDLVGGEE